mgnify:CR=1 FL=1
MVMVLCESCKHYGKKICMESSDYYCVDYEPNSNNESNSNIKNKAINEWVFRSVKLVQTVIILVSGLKLSRKSQGLLLFLKIQ